LYASGLINKQVAKACGVSERTFYRYKNVEEVMAVAIRGRKKATDRIVQSLYKKATGYDYAEVTMEPVIVNRQVDGKKEKVVEKEEQKITKVVIKHVQPDQGAIEFWLTNNDEKSWKKRIDVQSGGKDVEPCTFYLPHFNGSIQMPK
jgi:AcrR family transcriptional regulator